MFYAIIDTCHKLRDLDLDFYETPEDENNNNAAAANNNNAVPNNNPAPENNNNVGEQQPENNNEQAPNNANPNNDAQANQNQPNANNDVPVPAAVANEFSSKYLNFGRLFEKCTNLTSLAAQAPLGLESFRYQRAFDSAESRTNHTSSYPFVSTSIQRLTRFCTLDTLESDLPVFYFGECCPNLVGLDLDYSFSISYGKSRSSALPSLTIIHSNRIHFDTPIS
jgi:hypothetical protein